MGSSRFVVLLLLLLLQLLFQTTFQQLLPLPSLARFRAERAALLQLRSSLGLRSKQWPIKSNPCLNWEGILCQNGSVIGINISGFKRTRIGRRNPQFAVDALANLTNLVSFNASRFILPGSIPDGLGLQLQTLQLLDLRFCQISGAIPFTFGNLSNLNELYLSDNSLTGTIPSSLGQLSRLTVLDLSRNSLTGLIPSSFGSLLGLSSLDMSSNYLSGIIPEAFGNLPNLRFLNLSGNSLFSPIPTQLGNITSLLVLDLTSNTFSGPLPSQFAGLRNLQTLLIGNNLLSGNLSGDLFPPTSRLQILAVDRNNLTGNIPDALWSLPNLSFLDASDNSFTGFLPNLSLNAANITPAVFNLSHNMFYGGLTSVLRRLSSVDLSYNYLQGTVPFYARGVASLTRNCLRNSTTQRTVQDCATFYSMRDLPFDNFGFPNGTIPPPKSGHKSNRRVIILAAVLGGVGVIILLAILVILVVVCCRKRGTTTQRGTGVGPAPPTAAAGPPPTGGASLDLSGLGESFTYQQILAATGDFNEANLIKNGHSGDLFRGGIPVVIKRFDVRSGTKDAYMLELDLLSKVSHPRLVPLLGHCLENENGKFLVYKYMPNGDLSSSLYRKLESDDDSLQSLDWITRLKIALGLLKGSLTCIMNVFLPLDVQASSILLDDKYEVRLGSLSDVCSQEGDSHSNRFTRLLRLPQTSEQGASGVATGTCAYDVYCFGKVLLELVTGKMGISASNDPNTKDLLEGMLPYINIYDKELVTNIVDPSLIIDEDLLEEVWAMAVVARSCLNPKPTRRPLMRYILKALENPLKVVREESSSSARLRTPSSRGSWNAALFSSWRNSSTDLAAGAAAAGAGPSSLKQSGTTRSHSQGSGHNGGGDHSSSNRKQSKDVFPEPLDVQDEDRSDDEY
ncbi:hypothetical protein OSB04_006315 [Centaurea solstitialis]|uniref:Protein kinase domain-containing protein n=1 Tax=Centaurea solstitialis TaxID=347529 RepID=A0AA38WQ87_9ASTR|nr:hypothetical protein OSB04_006315 [Centaurea solstitialis]